MKVEISQDREEIENFILKNTEKNSYQYFKLQKWRNFISNFFKFQCFNLVIREKNEIISFFPVFLVNSKIFKNRFISIPFTGHGGGIVIKKGKEKIKIINLFMDELKEMAKKNNVDYLWVRGPRQEDIRDFLKAGFKEPLKDFNFFLDLSKGLEEIRTSMNKKLRNRLKKAEQEQIMVSEMTNKEGVNKAYGLHVKTMKRLGTPPKSKKFFSELLKTGDYHIYVAEHKDKPIAVSTFIMKETYATWYDGVALPEYKSFNAPTLILWHFIKNNINYIKIMDFGVSREGSTNYDYKKKWNPEIVRASKLYYFFNSGGEVVDPRSKKYSLFSLVWRKAVPGFIAKMIGPRIRKSMGS